MRLNVNLASRPFLNRRLYWAGVLSVFFLSLWFGLWISAEKSSVAAQADEIEARIKSQEDQVNEIKARQERERAEKVQTVIGESDVMQLVAARELIIRKSFSWNGLLSDIEGHVPRQARVLTIGVSQVQEVAGVVLATVELRVLGRDPSQMTEMMTSLVDSGGRFAILQATQEAALESNEVPFTLRVSYRPSRGGIR